MKSVNVKFITRTAILLALTLIFQMMGRFLGPNNNFIVGPLVNAVLIISTAAAGIWSGAAIAVIAPLVSALTNKAPIAPVILAFSPFIAAGNFILVLSYYFFRNKNRVIGVGIGAVLKFIFLFAAVSAFTSLMNIPPNFAGILNLLFSWPQLVTAVAGGIIALLVIKALGRSINM